MPTPVIGILFALACISFALLADLLLALARASAGETPAVREPSDTGTKGAPSAPKHIDKEPIMTTKNITSPNASGTVAIPDKGSPSLDFQLQAALKLPKKALTRADVAALVDAAWGTLGNRLRLRLIDLIVAYQKTLPVVKAAKAPAKKTARETKSVSRRPSARKPRTAKAVSK